MESNFSIAYRINDPARVGHKMWVCGTCVNDQEATDPTKMGQTSRCEQCGEKYSNPKAHERADMLLGRICHAAARRRADIIQ